MRKCLLDKTKVPGWVGHPRQAILRGGLQDLCWGEIRKGTRTAKRNGRRSGTMALLAVRKLFRLGIYH